MTQQLLQISSSDLLGQKIQHLIKTFFESLIFAERSFLTLPLVALVVLILAVSKLFENIKPFQPETN